MPTYEYACRACGEQFEVFQSMRDTPLEVCPKCGQAAVKRLIGRGAGIIFKGSGFYETDYKRPAKKDGGEGSGGGDKPAEKTSPAPSTPAPKAAESKPGSSTAAGAAPTRQT